MDHLSRLFGHHRVDPETRRKRVRAVFRAVAPRYDLMNDLMSGGMHRLWKREFAALAATEALTPVVDLAGGTGDIAIRLQGPLGADAIAIVDPSLEMLGVARGRVDAGVALVAAEGESLPFDTATIGTVTLAFGLRNMTEPVRVIEEAFRVLKPGGQFHILEFSQADAWFAPAYRLHSNLTIPLLGAMVAGNREAYRYLVDSIAGFPDAETVSATLGKAGFDVVSVRKLMFGVAAIHSARKPVN